MASYVITGASRGLGFEQIRQLSTDPNNLIVGLARDKDATIKKVKEELGERPNVHILHGDLEDTASLKQAAADSVPILGGKLDYLIANAGVASKLDSFSNLGEQGEDPETLEREYLYLHKVNVIGNINLINFFMPQVLAGKEKKVIAISSGLSDFDLVRKMEFDTAPLYAISKAALNMVVVKFQNQYKDDGVLCLAICPGMVEVGQYSDVNPEQLQKVQKMVGKFLEHYPHFAGAATPAQAVKDVISVYHKADLKNYAGDFVSHNGNKEWL
ncbi:uncharacterized protein BCR38DRAFT_453701 [Pseudomassariella vexata]|uniref:Short chain dehydrogenase n=1 Tax=Pseudomassariella vexata TaxID=1141098 RepID=A0A1Y2EHM7_9PEZI|nr:uncharacterized protein BCR38DRAFT_453701 [Pseudomassariella vexata]ORY71063.1 hypothetical protein BCR38DRAFT_453701 [Pseudomassariella vexata]